MKQFFHRLKNLFDANHCCCCCGCAGTRASDDEDRTMLCFLRGSCAPCPCFVEARLRCSSAPRSSSPAASTLSRIRTRASASEVGDVATAASAASASPALLLLVLFFVGVFLRRRRLPSAKAPFSMASSSSSSFGGRSSEDESSDEPGRGTKILAL